LDDNTVSVDNVTAFKDYARKIGILSIPW